MKILHFHRWWSHCFAMALLIIHIVSAYSAEPALVVERTPQIDPDYTGILIPPNIAPLNFNVQEPGTQYRVQIQSSQGQPIVIQGKTPRVQIPLQAWQALLQQNLGQALLINISVLTNSQWQQYRTITNTIARDPINGYLVYRLLHPQFSMFGSGTMGIYQRNLQTFEQRTVLSVKEPGSPCLNCHTFRNQQPDIMAMHIRSSTKGKPMLVIKNGQVETVNKPVGYMSWHPNGKVLAFSVNKLSLFYHSVGECRDVFDAASDLGLYYTDEHRVAMPPAIGRPDRLETWPAWSPDGRYLYFCSAPVQPRERFREVKYDLMRISYNPDNDAFGSVETMVAVKDTGLSSAQPKPSPDGKFLMFCLFPYGHFPIYQPASDLYLMDLITRRYRRLDEVNSDRTDSYHSWSSNSRWFVFSSKRRNAMLARPFISHLDTDGRATKPFIVPQEDPDFYDHFPKTFNVPELIASPIPVSQQALYEAIYAPKHPVTPRQDTPSPQSESQQSEGNTAEMKNQ